MAPFSFRHAAWHVFQPRDGWIIGGEKLVDCVSCLLLDTASRVSNVVIVLGLLHYQSFRRSKSGVCLRRATCLIFRSPGRSRAEEALLLNAPNRTVRVDVVHKIVLSTCSHESLIVLLDSLHKEVGSAFLKTSSFSPHHLRTKRRTMNLYLKSLQSHGSQCSRHPSLWPWRS